MAFNPTGSGIQETHHPDRKDKTRDYKTPPIGVKRAKGLLVAAEISALKLLPNMAELKGHYLFPQVHLLQTFDIDPAWLVGLLAKVDKDYQSGIEVGIRGDWLAWRSGDFIVCDSNTNILTGIEIDDDSHDTVKGAQRDGIKDLIFQRAEIPLLRFRDKEISRIEKITDQYLQQSEFTILWNQAEALWITRKAVLAAMS